MRRINDLIHVIYQDMSEHQAKIALLQLLYASRDGGISHEGLTKVVHGNAPESRMCVYCGERPGVRYMDRHKVCVKCWPIIAKSSVHGTQ